MSLTFPTGADRGTVVGTPLPARACDCRFAAGADTCVLCGHWPEATIRETWRVRARFVAGREKALAAV